MHSVVWNSITPANAINLEHIQRKFVAFWFNLFSPHVSYSYEYALGQLELHTSSNKMYQLDVPYSN
jgi:hypothetical protein